MNLADLQKHAQKIASKRALVARSEAAARLAFVEPLIRLLGYDPEDPEQVEPEHAGKAKGKKAEKVDYAILNDGKPVLIVEAKKCTEDLRRPKYWSRLFDYFTPSEATIAALTNGIDWHFYTDLVKPNTMDDAPFLELDLSKPSEETVCWLRRFAADQFKPDELRSRALRMRDVRVIKEFLEEQAGQPDDQELLRLLAERARPGKRKTKKLLGEIGVATTEALREFLREHAAQRSDRVLPLPPPPDTAKYCWFYKGQWHPATSWAKLYVAVVSRLHDECGGIAFYRKLRELIHGNKLGNIGRTPAAAGGHPVGVSGGWWLNTGLGQVAIKKKVAKACEAAGIKYGQDLVLK